MRAWSQDMHRDVSGSAHGWQAVSVKTPGCSLGVPIGLRKQCQTPGVSPQALRPSGVTRCASLYFLDSFLYGWNTKESELRKKSFQQLCTNTSQATLRVSRKFLWLLSECNSWCMLLEGFSLSSLPLWKFSFMNSRKDALFTSMAITALYCPQRAFPANLNTIKAALARDLL